MSADQADRDARGMKVTVIDGILRGVWPAPELAEAITTPLIRIPAYSPGDRVIVPPTSGALDPMYRRGGHGVVSYVREIDGETFVYVRITGAVDSPQPYRLDEIQREPTV